MAADTRNWIVEPEVYADEDGVAQQDEFLSDREIANALLELAPMLKRLGGSVIVNADRTKVGDPDIYQTPRLVVSYTLHLPLAKRREVEAVEESEPAEEPERLPDPEPIAATG